jgi:hypothetical protein
MNNLWGTEGNQPYNFGQRLSFAFLNMVAFEFSDFEREYVKEPIGEAIANLVDVSPYVLLFSVAIFGGESAKDYLAPILAIFVLKAAFAHNAWSVRRGRPT